MSRRAAHIALVLIGVSMSATPVLAAPALTVTPTNGHPKIATQVSGTGFTANEAVDVYFDTTDKFLAVTDGTGEFAAQELDIPNNATPGLHWVTAVGRKTGDATQLQFRVQTSWLSFGFDQQDRGRNPYEDVIDTSNVGTLDVAWSFATGGFINNSSAVYNGASGTIYVGSSDHKLYALNSTTGSVKWSATVGAGIRSTPAVANGRVYVGSDDGKVYAFNAATGAPVWSAVTGGGVTSSPVVVSNKVYVGSADDKMYAFNGTTGAVIWSTLTGASISFSSPAVANGMVYIGSLDEKLYALDAGTGAVLWTVTTGSAIFSSPAVSNGAVYFGSCDSKVYAASAKTGSLYWTYTAGACVAGSPAVVNNTVFIGSSDDNFYAIDAASGLLKWVAPLGGSADTNSTSIANGVVYLGVNGSRAIYGFDVKTGTALWSAHAANAFDARPTIADGKLYMTSLDNSVYAFALDGGSNAVYHGKRTPPSYASLHPDFRLKPLK